MKITIMLWYFPTLEKKGYAVYAESFPNLATKKFKTITITFYLSSIKASLGQFSIHRLRYHQIFFKRDY